MKEPSKEQIKERTKHLRQVLKEKYKIDLPQGHALEVMAKVFGFKDWNTASALAVTTQELESQPTIKNDSVTTKVLPPALKLQTAGDYVDFFSRFNANEKVFIYEYKNASLEHFGTPTSICSTTYDSEIQSDSEVRLELHTENEKNLQINDFGKSSNQKFELTKNERLQRIIKWFNMQNGGFWSPSNYLHKTEK